MLTWANAPVGVWNRQTRSQGRSHTCSQPRTSPPRGQGTLAQCPAPTVPEVPVVADDVDPLELLSQPLVARVATTRPRVRPVWFLYDESCFWWLTGPWTTLPEEITADPRVSLVVDTCDLETGAVLQVVAHGPAELVEFDADRARRKLTRYLGDDVDAWDPRFRETLDGTDQAQFVRVDPARLIARDLSYRSALHRG